MLAASAPIPGSLCSPISAHSPGSLSSSFWAGEHLFGTPWCVMVMGMAMEDVGMGDMGQHACLEEASQVASCLGYLSPKKDTCFFEIILLLLKMHITGSLCCARASSLSRSGKGAEKLLV